MKCPQSKLEINEIVDKFSTLISIAGTLPSKITSLTGITDEMLVGQPPIEAALTEYIGFLGDDTIVGHNISSFDLNILYDSLLKIAGAKLSNDFIDTLRFAKHCDIECGNLKLSTICDYFHIENNQAHRSLSDCIANHYCYQKLKELYRGEKCSHEIVKKAIQKKNIFP